MMEHKDVMIVCVLKKCIPYIYSGFISWEKIFRESLALAYFVNKILKIAFSLGASFD